MLFAIRQLLLDDGGGTLAEYALILALVMLVCIAVMTKTGTHLSTLFHTVSKDVKTAAKG